jgi:hypothetical protein
MPRPCHSPTLPCPSWKSVWCRKYPICYSYGLTEWYASDKNLRGTPRGSRKKPNAGRSPTYRFWTADANLHMPRPCHVYAALCRGLEKSLSERHGRDMAWARHGMCESNTAALCKSNGGRHNLNP